MSSNIRAADSATLIFRAFSMRGDPWPSRLMWKSPDPKLKMIAASISSTSSFIAVPYE